MKGSKEVKWESADKKGEQCEPRLESKEGEFKRESKDCREWKIKRKQKGQEVDIKSKINEKR